LVLVKKKKQVWVWCCKHFSKGKC